MEGNSDAEARLSITQQLNTEELEAGWRALDALRPRFDVRVTVGAKTDLGGVRENNEDKYDMLEPREPSLLAGKGCLYGVADGMGGHSAGQIASEVALKSLIRAYYNLPNPDIAQSLRDAFGVANLSVHENAQVLPERHGMGTTLTAAIVCENRLFVAHVGDSRAYIIRDGAIRQITTDHSWVAEQVRIGGMSLEEALASPFRNIILRSIGTGLVVEPDVFEDEVRAGDVILLCSDGLTTHLSDEEIAEAASLETLRRLGPSVAALYLVEIANDRGGRDNITVLLVLVESIKPVAAESESALSASAAQSSERADAGHAEQ